MFVDLPHDWRERVVAEARSWIGTPYHHAANLKGVGVDCVFLLIETFKTVGFLEPGFDPRPYPKDWYLHRGDELFMEGLFKYARRLKRDERPQPGDVALYRVGRTASHGAIIVDDEHMIHAYAQSRRVEECELDMWAHRLERYWSVI